MQRPSVLTTFLAVILLAMTASSVMAVEPKVYQALELIGRAAHADALAAFAAFVHDQPGANTTQNAIIAVFKKFDYKREDFAAAVAALASGPKGVTESAAFIADKLVAAYMADMWENASQYPDTPGIAEAFATVVKAAVKDSTGAVESIRKDYHVSGEDALAAVIYGLKGYSVRAKANVDCFDPALELLKAGTPFGGTPCSRAAAGTMVGEFGGHYWGIYR